MMKQKIRIGLLSCALAGSLNAATGVAQERFVTIGTGGQTGVYYTAGQSVCRFLNRAEVQPAIKCNAPSTAGSVTNIVALESGEYELIISEPASEQMRSSSAGHSFSVSCTLARSARSPMCISSACSVARARATSCSESSRWPSARSRHGAWVQPKLALSPLRSPRP